MEQRLRSPRRLEGRVAPPGDKSISHRAAILNALARGQARVLNFSPGADCLSTVACLRALGVEIEVQEIEGRPGLLIAGAGGPGLREAADVLDAGNSGTTLRLLAGMLSGQPFLSIITGDDSLRSRPMGRIVEPLRAMGAHIWGRGRDTLAPLAIRGGPLRGIDYALPVASAQVKSALLLAGLSAQGPTRLAQPAASRDHTELMLQAMGVRLEVEGLSVTLHPPSSPLAPLDLRVPGDISAAAFWMVAGAIHPQARIEIQNVGLNPTRTGILEALQAMGARLALVNRRQEGLEEVADILVESGPLVATQVAGDLVPRLIDEVPVLAVAAALARGTTVIRDAGELRVKESDRIATTVAELSRLGARIQELPDGMVIEGVPHLRGAPCSSHGDHRLAMALGIAGLVAQGETLVYNAEAADISYPGFWEDLARLAHL